MGEAAWHPFLSHACAEVIILCRLKFQSGKTYIGIASGSLSARIASHLKSVKKGSLCLVHRAWRKHGAPIAETLAIIERSQMKATERRAIAAFNTMGPNGYNMTPGGDFNPTIGRKLSATHRAKISAAGVGRKASPETLLKLSAAKSGKNHPMYGRKHSPSSREKISASLKTTPCDSHSKKGHKPSPESEAKRSLAMKGNKNLLGRVHSPETKAKMSLAHRNRMVPK